MTNKLIKTGEFELHWQMADCEQWALLGLLKKLQPKMSLEIGTYLGGSLQVLSRFSESVFSVDIDPAVSSRLAGKFPNVKFCSGDSRLVVPDLIREINRQKWQVGFVLVDGDHSTEGIRRDIEALTELQVQQDVVILLHDSFNPACREGMRTANWSNSPFIHYVELDFIPGIYHYQQQDTAEPRSMWGGFACAILSPERRSEKLVIQESQRNLFEAVKRDSRYRFDGMGLFWRRALRLFEKLSQTR